MQVPSVRPSIVTETAVGEIASSQGIRAGRQCVLVFYWIFSFRVIVMMARCMVKYLLPASMRTAVALVILLLAAPFVAFPVSANGTPDMTISLLDRFHLSHEQANTRIEFPLKGEQLSLELQIT